MKKISKLIFTTLLALTLTNCSSDDSESSNPEAEAGVPMTTKINGTFYNMYSPFGDDTATESIFSYYPDEEYILLKGQIGGWLGGREISLYIKRSHLIAGTTYQVGSETDEVTTHIDYLDNTNDNPDFTTENTVSGQIHIIATNPTAKTVRGTFNFESLASNGLTTYSFTEGTFNFRYDVE